MRKQHQILYRVLVALAGVSVTCFAQVPGVINYQGRVVVNGTNFAGTGHFKFALVDGTGTTTFWSHDGTGAGEPATAVSITVSKGLYSVLLGQSPMVSISAAVFTNTDVRLRVWFDGGSGIQQLSPDQRIGAVGYAFVAGALRADTESFLSDHEVYLRGVGDPNHGLGWYGDIKLFAGVNLDGPALYGYSGGALGTHSDTQHIALVWNDAGRVGIGTTTPADKLEVAGRILLNGPYGNLDGVDVSWLANSGKTLLGGNKSGGEGEADFIQNRGSQGSDGGFAFHDVANDGTSTRLMSLKGNGNVGIGIAGPVERLEVAGAVKFGNTANPAPAAGTIRWTGTDFQGFNGSQWVSLSAPGSASADMVLVPGGTFTMGSTAVDQDPSPDPVPEHQVTLGSFYLAKCEVSYDLWYAIKQWGASNAYYFQNAGREGNHGTNGAVPTAAAGGEPVNRVGWRDCVVWCNARSEKDGLMPVYTYSNQVVRDSRDANATACDNAVFNTANSGYRLPTEAEWEYAARYVNGWSWTPGDFASGGGVSVAGYDTSNDSNTVADAVAWYWKNSGNKTHVVGSKKPNQLGLFDMSGNALEWCWDWYDTYASGAVTNPVGPASGSWRLIRDNGYGSVAFGLQCAWRSATSPGTGNLVGSGFRCARSAQ